MGRLLWRMGQGVEAYGKFLDHSIIEAAEWEGSVTAISVRAKSPYRIIKLKGTVPVSSG